jgi:hypothetical protein
MPSVIRVHLSCRCAKTGGAGLTRKPTRLPKRDKPNPRNQRTGNLPPNKSKGFLIAFLFDQFCAGIPWVCAAQKIRASIICRNLWLISYMSIIDGKFGRFQQNAKKRGKFTIFSAQTKAKPVLNALL